MSFLTPRNYLDPDERPQKKAKSFKRSHTTSDRLPIWLQVKSRINRESQVKTVAGFMLV